MTGGGAEDGVENGAARGLERGGAPVGQIGHLGPVEAGAVLYLRLWSDGPAGQRDARADFDLALGRDGAEAALAALGGLCDLCARHGRRPLVRHALTCRCIGADESCFATLVAAATEGAREDAMLLAALLVRADMAPALTDLAQRFGLALRRMACAAPPAATPPAPAPARHLH